MKNIKRLVTMLAFSMLAQQVWAVDPIEACKQGIKAGDLKGAVKAAQAALNTDQAREAYLCVGRAQSMLGDTTAAIEAFKQADVASQSNMDHTVALILLGRQYQAAKAFPEALVTFNQSLALAQADKLEHFEMMNLNAIGEVYQAQGDIKQAMHYYEMAQKLALNDNERADSDERLASLYHTLGDADRALEYQLRAVQMENRAGDVEHYSNAYLFLSQLYIEQKQYDQANRYLSKLKLAISTANEPYWEARTALMLGKLNAVQGKKTEALDFYTQATQLAEKVGAKDLIAEVSAEKSKL